MVRGFDNVDKNLVSTAELNADSTWMRWRELWDTLFRRDWLSELMAALVADFPGLSNPWTTPETAVFGELENKPVTQTIQTEGDVPKDEAGRTAVLASAEPIAER